MVFKMEKMVSIGYYLGRAIYYEISKPVLVKSTGIIGQKWLNIPLDT